MLDEHDISLFFSCSVCAMLWQVESYAAGNADAESTPQDRQETTEGELSNCSLEATVSD